MGVEVEVYRTSSLRYVGAVLAELVLARPAGFQLGPGRPRAPDQCLAVHLDGEPAGTVPASFEVVAGAITVLAAPGAPAFRRIPSAP